MEGERRIAGIKKERRGWEEGIEEGEDERKSGTELTKWSGAASLSGRLASRILRPPGKRNTVSHRSG